MRTAFQNQWKPISTLFLESQDTHIHTDTCTHTYTDTHRHLHIHTEIYINIYIQAEIYLNIIRTWLNNLPIEGEWIECRV